jgi:galactitol-specific phosphotransferase system IIC component
LSSYWNYWNKRLVMQLLEWTAGRMRISLLPHSTCAHDLKYIKSASFLHDFQEFFKCQQQTSCTFAPLASAAIDSRFTHHITSCALHLS